MSAKSCILCLDDDAEILKSLKLLFEKDYEVLTTTSPYQALGLLKTHKVNLIISDHRMPEMNGLEFFQKVKEEHGDKQYYKIIYSGYSEMEKDMIKIIESFKELPHPEEELPTPGISDSVAIQQNWPNS